MVNRQRLIKKGINYYLKNSYNKAIELFNKIDTELSYFYLGRIYSEKRDYKTALENFEKCLMIHEKEYGDINTKISLCAVKEIVPPYLQEYINSMDQSQKIILKDSLKKRLVRLEQTLHSLNKDYWAFSAIMLENENNKKEALEAWETAYHVAMSHESFISMGSEKPNHLFSPVMGWNLNKLIERISALKIMNLSENKKEALEYLFSSYNLGSKYSFKIKSTGKSLDNVMIEEEKKFLKVYNKKVSPEVKKIEDAFLKTGSLDELIYQIQSSPNYSKNIDFQFALSLLYHLKGKNYLSSKLMKSALQEVFKQKNEHINDIPIKSKNKVKQYSHVFSTFRIFPEIEIILKKGIGQEIGIIKHYQKEGYKKNLALNLPDISGSLNHNKDTWYFMIPLIEHDSLIYLNNCSEKEKLETIQDMIRCTAKIHTHAPSYDSGLISLLHTSDYLKNKQFYGDQIKNRFLNNVNKLSKPKTQTLTNSEENQKKFEEKFFRSYLPVIDIISKCSPGVYKDAFLKNFLIFEACGYNGVCTLDFETFSNFPYQMDLATLFEFGVMVDESKSYDRKSLLKTYIREFNNQIDKHKLKKNKIKNIREFEKEYFACAVQRNLALFGSFIKVNEKKEYLSDCISNSITNVYNLLDYTSEEDHKKLNDLIKELKIIRANIE